MGFFGNLIGKGLGGLAGSIFGDKGRDVGSELGGTLGSNFIPFRRGGRVGVVMREMPAMKKGGKAKKVKKRAESPEPMRKGGKAGKRPTKKGPSMDAYMRKLRQMRK